MRLGQRMRRAQWVQRVQRVQFWQQRSQSVQWVQTWSSTTIRGSCSTATTFLQHSSSLSVRLPVPGPISRTVSVALIPAFSIIAAVTSGFLSKCCPSEWWSSTPAWRYGAAAWRCSGFFSRPTLGMSSSPTRYRFDARRLGLKVDAARAAVHSPLRPNCASLRGGLRTKGAKLFQRRLYSLPSVPKHTRHRRHQKALIALRPEATRARAAQGINRGGQQRARALVPTLSRRRRTS